MNKTCKKFELKRNGFKTNTLESTSKIRFIIAISRYVGNTPLETVDKLLYWQQHEWKTQPGHRNENSNWTSQSKNDKGFMQWCSHAETVVKRPEAFEP